MIGKVASTAVVVLLLQRSADLKRTSKALADQSLDLARRLEADTAKRLESTPEADTAKRLASTPKPSSIPVRILKIFGVAFGLAGSIFLLYPPLRDGFLSDNSDDRTFAFVAMVVVGGAFGLFLRGWGELAGKTSKTAGANYKAGGYFIGSLAFVATATIGLLRAF